jgi:formylglycine-generating enzyme required for sulfatase activity
VAGTVLIDGADTGVRVKAQETVTVRDVAAGLTDVVVRDSGGALVKANPVPVRPGETASAVIAAPASEAGRDDDEVQHRVTVGGFYMGRTEVTVGEFRRFVYAAGYRTTMETSGGGYVWTGGDWKQKAVQAGTTQ